MHESLIKCSPGAANQATANIMARMTKTRLVYFQNDFQNVSMEMVISLRPST
jgi:hypothetical protein